jgi:hypothetical protein
MSLAVYPGHCPCAVGTVSLLAFIRDEVGSGRLLVERRFHVGGYRSHRLLLDPGRDQRMDILCDDHTQELRCNFIERLSLTSTTSSIKSS